MRLTGSGVYTRPAGVPKMPPGLVELMEGLTKDVLKHNPADVYEFCANHMKTLLEIRDGRAPDRPLTLERKIARAQQKIRQKAEERCKKYDMEMKFLSGKSERENEQTSDNISVTTIDKNIEKSVVSAQNQTDVRNVLENQKQENSVDTLLENTLKAPVHHENNIEKSEVSAQNRTDVGNALENEKQENSVETLLENTLKAPVHHENNIKKLEVSPLNQTDMRNELKPQKQENSIETLIENTLKAPVHHEKDLADALEVEIYHKATDFVQNPKNDDTEIFKQNEVMKKDDELAAAEESDMLKDNLLEDNKRETLHEESKSSDIHFNFQENEALVENDSANTLENVSDTTNVTEYNKPNVEDDVLSNDKYESPDHIRKPRSSIESKDEMVDSEDVGEKDNNIHKTINYEVGEEHNREDKTDVIITLDNVGDVDNGEVISEKLSQVANHAIDMNDCIVKTDEVPIDSVADANKDVTADIPEYIEEVLKNNEVEIDIDEKQDSKGVIYNVKSVTDTTEENVTTEKLKIIAMTAYETGGELSRLDNDNVKFTEVADEENTIEKIPEKTDDFVESKENILDNDKRTINNAFDKASDAVAELVSKDSKATDDLVENVVDNIKINDYAKQELSENKVTDIINVADNGNDKDLEESEILKDSLDTIMETADEIAKSSIEGNKTETAIEKKAVIMEDKLIKEEKLKANVINTITESTISANAVEDTIYSGEITDNNQVDSITDLVASNNDIKSSEQERTVESDHTNNHEERTPSPNPANITSDDAPLEIKVEYNSSNVNDEKIGISVTTENTQNADNIDDQKIPETENISKENSLENSDDKDKDTLLESPTLDNIKTVIKSEVSMEEVSSSDLGRIKRDLENILETQEISESVHPSTETNSIKKSSSMDSTISNNSILELDTVKSSDVSTPVTTQNHSNMDLETAAVTIQKVFRNFMFKSRGSTFDDTGNDDNNLTDEDNDKEEIDFSAPAPAMNKDRRTLGICRMDTVLQTVNEEKSLSLSTDDSSTLSSAATVIQAHVRGFLVRNRLNSNKTASSNSLVNSEGPSNTSLEADNDLQKANKTILNIHIVPGDHYLSRDESVITSMDLSLDGSPPSSTNLHPLGYDKSEPRKQLKREDAIQSVSPPSNNSGKLSEDVDSMKEVLNNDANVDQNTNESYVANEQQQVPNDDRRDTIPTRSTTIETVIASQKCSSNDSVSQEPEKELSELQQKRGSLTKMSSDESDVVTPFLSEDKGVSPDSGKSSGLLHSGEFHDIVMPTKVSRSDTTVVREFKNALVYFLLLDNS